MPGGNERIVTASKAEMVLLDSDLSKSIWRISWLWDTNDSVIGVSTNARLISLLLCCTAAGKRFCYRALSSA